MDNKLITITIDKFFLYLLFLSFTWFFSLYFLYSYLEDRFNSKILTLTNTFQQRVGLLSNDLSLLQTNYESMQKMNELSKVVSSVSQPSTIVQPYSSEFYVFLYKIIFISIIVTAAASILYLSFLSFKSILFSSFIGKLLASINASANFWLDYCFKTTEIAEFKYIDELHNIFKVTVNLDNKTCEIAIKAFNATDFIPLTDFFRAHPDVFNNVTTQLSEDLTVNIMTAAIEAAPAVVTGLEAFNRVWGNL